MKLFLQCENRSGAGLAVWLSPRKTGCATVAALFLCAAAPAFAETPVPDPGVCPYRGDLGRREHGAQADTIRAEAEKKSTIKDFVRPQSEWFRLRLVIHESEHTAPGWEIRLEAKNYDPGREERCAREFSVKSADVASRGRDLMTPVFCDALWFKARVVEEDGERKWTPEVTAFLFQLEAPTRQLQSIEGGKAAAEEQANFCLASDFRGGAPGPEPDGESGEGTYSPIIPGAHDRLLEAARSVVYVGFEIWRAADEEESRLSNCTGFFIAPRLILTNRHCVCPAENGTACPENADFPAFGEGVKFKWLGDGDKLYAGRWRVWSRAVARNRGEAPTFQSVRPLLLGDPRNGEAAYKEQRTEHPRLDYAVLEIRAEEAALYEADFPVTPAPAPRSFMPLEKGAPLAMPQYPGNYPFAVNFDADCILLPGEDDSEIDTEDPKVKAPYFTHGCDSAPGSSGSPVFDRAFRGVVGLHFCCAPDTGHEMNKMASVTRIICDIRKREPDLFDRIKQAQAWGLEEKDYDETCNGL